MTRDTPEKLEKNKGRTATYRIDRLPFLAEELGNLAGPQSGVLGSDLWPALAGENHERVHGALRSAIRIQSLGDERVGVGLGDFASSTDDAALGGGRSGRRVESPMSNVTVVMHSTIIDVWDGTRVREVRNAYGPRRGRGRNGD